MAGEFAVASLRDSDEMGHGGRGEDSFQAHATQYSIRFPPPGGFQTHLWARIPAAFLATP